MPFPPTDWGPWTEEEYEVGAPATSNHFERWFRNVVAAFQGAAGAPRLQGPAHHSPGLGNVRQRNCLPYGLVIAQSFNSTGERHYLGEMTALVNCSVRIVYSATVSITGTAPSVAVGIFKNGVFIGGLSASTGTATATDVVIDVTLVAGDCIGATLLAAGQAGGSEGNGGTATLSRLEYLVDVTTAGLI